MGLLDFAKSISRNFEISVSEYKSREWRFGNFRVNFFRRNFINSVSGDHHFSSLTF